MANLFQNGNACFPILQQVEFSTTTKDTTNSTSFVASSTSVSITPKRSTSKILIIAHGQLALGYSTIARNGTSLYHPSIGGIRSDNSSFATHCYLDTAGTTSPITYAVYFRAITSGGVWNNDFGGSVTNTATIRVFEIAQ